MLSLTNPSTDEVMLLLKCPLNDLYGDTTVWLPPIILEDSSAFSRSGDDKDTILLDPPDRQECRSGLVKHPAGFGWLHVLNMLDPRGRNMGRVARDDHLFGHCCAL